MLRVPFNLERSKSNSLLFESGHSVSEVKLNDEWKIEFTWNEFSMNAVPSSSPQYLKICRQITSEEMLVSGTLSHKSSGQLVSIEEFSKLIKPGDSFVTIPLRDLPHNIPSSGLFRQFCNAGPRTLDGIVYITSTRGAECKKCTQLKSLDQLSNDFEKLLDPQTSSHSDVDLKCGDELIQAHKNILCTRSTEFAKKMNENYEGPVVITEIDAPVLRAMLAFMYTGKTSSLTVSSASDLLRAAHEYKLEDLKRECCDFLKENVSLQNVLRLLVLGDEYSEGLKSFAVDYFCSTCTDITAIEETEEWITLSNQKPLLIIHVLRSALKSRDRKLNGAHVP